MRLFSRLGKNPSTPLPASASESSTSNSNATPPPPPWAPAPEVSRQYGLYNEAPEEEYIAAEEFCTRHPPDRPRMLPSSEVDRINSKGCAAWAVEVPTSPRFVGRVQQQVTMGGDGRNSSSTIKITTGSACKDVCILSDLPLMSGLYNIQGKRGVYYEVEIKRMDGLVAIGKCPARLRIILQSPSELTRATPPHPLRHILSTVSILETPRMEQAERRTPPGRRSQVLRRPRWRP